MDSKFESVPLDSDTKILFQEQMTFGTRDVLFQKWNWDGITAESLIFVERDLDGLNDEELLAEVKASQLAKKESRMTIKRTENGFLFVNFNFVTD